MYNYTSLVVIFFIVYLILNINTIDNTIENTIENTIDNTIENFKFSIKMPSTKNIGNTIKKVEQKASSIATIIPIPIPKKSYVPKTYPKPSYGIGVGKIPIIITMRPLKPGIKASKI